MTEPTFEIVAIDPDSVTIPPLIVIPNQPTELALSAVPVGPYRWDSEPL